MSSPNPREESPQLPGLGDAEVASEPPEGSPSGAYADAAARGYAYAPGQVPRDFPIVEAFGYPPNATSNEAVDARARCWCPFMDSPCLKVRSSAETGICSIRYKAAGFDTQMSWAVCQHRLKGKPFKEAARRHFGAATDVRLVTEVGIDDPRMSLDGIATRPRPDSDDIDLVGIEAQTIDTRGGSLKPAWNAYTSGRPEAWREFYPKRPSYGVNTANVWKRLLPQVMNKGRLYRGWDSKLYVLVHDPVFQVITQRMPLDRLPLQASKKAEIVWLLWDYESWDDDTGHPRDPETEMLVTRVHDVVYTTIDQVEQAFVKISFTPRNELVRRIRKRLGR